jgi:hypothetical protein
MLISKALAMHTGIAVMVSALTAGIARTESAEPAVEDDGTRTVHSRFDSGAWKQDAAGVRRQMAEDLIDRGLLVGKTPAEVRTLLGEPDEQGQDYFGYLVYAGSGSAMRPAYAVRVDFDVQGKVVEDAQIDASLGA